MHIKTLFFLLLLAICWQPAFAQEQTEDTTKHDPAEYLSNTLPVLYINTDNEAPIVDRENYIDGSYYLDANGCDYESIGTEENQLSLQIRGRGNATWQAPKKPYRLKLETKAALLGMPKSKHWVLLTAYGDWMAHGRDYMSFKISEKMGMPFTPGCIPCEVVLNGDYIGMYFLTEQIRVAKERVNIVEQSDGETDSLAITGGWLLEIDNYNGDTQIRFPDPKKDNKTIKITYHSPEELSVEQLNYLTDLMYKVNDAVNTDDKTSREWEEYIDIDALARFYVLEEALDNREAFSGSSWFYKDRGENTKLIWGPHWDGGSCFGGRNRDQQTCNFFYLDEPPFALNHWIEEICKFPRFQTAIRKWWKKYRDEVFPTMQEEIDAFGQLTDQALAADFQRWEDLSASNPGHYRSVLMRFITNKRNFLATKWDNPIGDINLDGTVNSNDVTLLYNFLIFGDDQYAETSDLNGDGTVNANDITMLYEILLDMAEQ